MTNKTGQPFDKHWDLGICQNILEHIAEQLDHAHDPDRVVRYLSRLAPRIWPAPRERNVNIDEES